VTARRPRRVGSQPVSTSRFPAAASADDRVVTAERCAAQLLCGDRAGSAGQVARRLLAIQAQDLRGARLAVRARLAGLSASDVDAALADRSLVVSWLNRGTLHLVRAEDYWWLHPLTTPQLRTGNSRRLAQEGVPPGDAERAVATVRAALAADGPLVRSQLRERVAAAGVRTEGQALVHILALASIRGLIVRGPAAGGEQAFVLARDWLGAPPPAMGREAALGELASGPACCLPAMRAAGGADLRLPQPVLVILIRMLDQRQGRHLLVLEQVGRLDLNGFGLAPCGKDHRFVLEQLLIDVERCAQQRAKRRQGAQLHAWKVP
jgi:hypothetical protein